MQINNCLLNLTDHFLFETDTVNKIHERSLRIDETELKTIELNK